MRMLLTLIALPLLLVGCSAPNRTDLGYGFYELEKPSGKLVRQERGDNGKVIERVWVEGYDGWVEGGSQVVARFDTRVMVQHFPDMRDIDSGDIGAQFQRLKEKSTYSVIRLDTAQTDELGTIDDIMASYPEGDIVRVTAELPYRLMGEIGEWLGEATEKITAPAGR